MILYEGPSRLDGSPIVVILTADSKNVKTGDVLQTWILDQRMDPFDAVKAGLDTSICGDCKLRGGLATRRACYVNLAWAPRNIYRTWRAGGYPEANPSAAMGRVVRLGAYGDPAAVPVATWTELLRCARDWLGYTHQWRHALDLRPYCMASVDSAEEAREAHQLGWRTFRVRVKGEPLIATPREVVCPASAEAPRKITCAQCRLCDGNTRDKAPNVAIYAHGAMQGFVESSRVQVPLFEEVR